MEYGNDRLKDWNEWNRSEKGETIQHTTSGYVLRVFVVDFLLLLPRIKTDSSSGMVCNPECEVVMILTDLECWLLWGREF